MSFPFGIGAAFLFGLLVGIALTLIVIWEVQEWKMEKYLNRLEQGTKNRK
jgi:hypothetical protein